MELTFGGIRGIIVSEVRGEPTADKALLDSSRRFGLALTLARILGVVRRRCKTPGMRYPYTQAQEQGNPMKP